jgi:hypothetical protein
MTFLIPHLLAGPLIPFSIDWLHCPWINATVHSLSGSDERIPMLLSSVGGYSMIGRSNWDNTTVSLSTTDGEYITPPNVVFANVCYGSCSLSLGPRSGLTNAYGSTTVIKFHNDKEHGFLSLGVRDLSEFESLCIPDSLIAISSFATRATFRSPWVITHYFSFIFYLYEEECMTVPAPFAERVVELLELSGAFQTSTKVFENCNSRSLANLPDIELELGEPVSGSIVLSATDYVAINSSTNTCHLRFSVGPAFQQIGINFYAIPGLNVRITQDQIQLCDSAL